MYHLYLFDRNFINKVIMRVVFALLCFFVNTYCFASEPTPWQVLFQPPASPIMEELEWFHNFLMVICTAIVFFVLALIIYVSIRFNAKANPVPATFTHNILIEIIWTIIPVIVLVIIAVPSFRILKFVEKSPPADLIIKVVGYQWYWHYIYPDNGLEFDSYIIPEANLKPGQRRLLEVDNRLVIPANVTVKFLVTGGDVMHSFALPSLGIKTDAIPGRVNESWTRVAKKGVYYGQCSELCGVNHGFMPIALEVVSKEEYDSWLVATKAKFAKKSSKFAKSK